MPILRSHGQTRVLRAACFGDSITAGLVATWRGPLATLFGRYYSKPIQWMGWNVVSSGTNNAMIGASGITLDTLVNNAIYATENCLNALKLDVALIHITSNDATAGKTVEEVTDDMNVLLDRLRAANPNCQVFLAKVTPNTNATPDANTVLYGAVWDSLKASRADGAYIHIPDMRAAFLAVANWETELMNDSIHPNNRGAAIQAQVFYDSMITVF